jgi:hypothetical protein
MAQQPLLPGANLPPLPQGPQVLPAIAAPVQPGGAAAAAPLQGVGGGGSAPLQAQVHHRTFAGLYSDETRDPLHTQYVAVMQRFNAAALQAQTGADLLQSILDNVMMPSAFLCCAALHAGAPARIYLLHALSRYPQAPDGTESPWDNQIFGYLGEILQESATLVAIPRATFNEINYVGVRVYNNETLAI